MLLRFGVGALLFLPYLALRFRAIGRDAWLQGIPLTLFQGAGMAALVICGLQFAPPATPHWRVAPAGPRCSGSSSPACRPRSRGGKA
jgi:hypothetical protein